MTDAPEGPAEGEPERGTRRSTRAGDGGSPVGSTLSIVLAVIAVIAGFLILRAITDDDDGGDAGAITPITDGSTPGAGTGDGRLDAGHGRRPRATAPPVAKSAATVVVANASGVRGSAAGMTQALTGAGYTMGEPGDATGENLAATIVYYVDGDATAQAVAALVAADMGGVQTGPMPIPPPIQQGLGAGTVLVMVGTDTAGKTLADLAAADGRRRAPARRRPPLPDDRTAGRCAALSADGRRSEARPHRSACSMHQRGSSNGRVRRRSGRRVRRR